MRNLMLFWQTVLRLSSEWCHRWQRILKLFMVQPSLALSCLWYITLCFNIRWIRDKTSQTGVHFTRWLVAMFHCCESATRQIMEHPPTTMIQFLHYCFLRFPLLAHVSNMWSRNTAFWLRSLSALKVWKWSTEGTFCTEHDKRIQFCLKSKNTVQSCTHYILYTVSVTLKQW